MFETKSIDSFVSRERACILHMDNKNDKLYFINANTLVRVRVLAKVCVFKKAKQAINSYLHRYIYGKKYKS
jgi:hypothetical protein